MAKQIYVGRQPRWYENLPVSPAVLVVALAVVVIGVGVWALTGIFTAPAQTVEPEAELGDVNDVALELVAVEDPDPAFDAAAVDNASGDYEINLFSAIDGTSLVLDDSQTASIDEAIADFAYYGYQTGFVVLDLHTGKGIGYNADEEFFSASTIKAPFVAFLWQSFIEGGSVELDDTLVKDVTYGGTGVMASEEDKLEYELEEVIADTIIYSDNTGYAMLRDHYDGGSWDEWTALAGVPQAETEVGRYLNYCACDLAKYWLAIDGYLATNSEGAQSLKELFGSTEVSFLRQALGSECEVYAKAGFQSSNSTGGLSALNDAGIVESPSGDYLLVVMSDADYSHPDQTENASLMIDLIKVLDGAHADLLAV